MKLRKMIASLAVAALLCAALAVPAFAADLELGEFTIVSNDNQKGWLTDGVDNTASPFTAEQFASAEALVLEFAAAPAGGLQVVWQGDGDGWAWNQTDGVIPDDGMAETSITINLSETLKNYDAFKTSTQIKLILGYWSNNLDDLQITKAYLTGVAAAPAEEAPADETPVTDDGQNLGNKEVTTNPKTGDSFLLFAAIAALALTGSAAFVLLRKKVSE